VIELERSRVVHKTAKTVLENQPVVQLIPPDIWSKLVDDYEEYFLGPIVKSLKKDVDQLKEKVAQLEKHLDPELIKIDDSIAEKGIINLYKTTDKPLYYVNIAETLNLPLKQVVKIVEDLLEREVIEEVAIE